MLWLPNGPLTRYAKLRVAHAPGMSGTFSPPSRVSDPNMHYGPCVTPVPWRMLESLTSSFVWSRWRRKRSRHFSACATRNSVYLVRGPLQRYVQYHAMADHSIKGLLYLNFNDLDISRVLCTNLVRSHFQWSPGHSCRSRHQGKHLYRWLHSCKGRSHKP